MKDCIFCKIVAGDVPSTQVHADDAVVAFRDLNPQAPTHVLIIPRKHIAGTNDLAPEDDALVGRIHRAAAKIAGDLGIGKSGYRLVLNCGRQAGQSVFHLHYHLLGGRPLAWPPG